MKTLLAPVLISALAAGSVAVAQSRPQPQRQPPRTDLSPLNDEFDGRSLDPRWTLFHQRFGWADMLKKMDVGASVPGALHLQPFDSAWVRDRIAPFLFQTPEAELLVCSGTEPPCRSAARDVTFVSPSGRRSSPRAAPLHAHNRGRLASNSVATNIDDPRG